MNFRYAGIALAVGAAIALGSAMGPAASQEPSESHLAAAREAVDAVGMTDEFDNILPQAAMALKNELTQKNPDQVKLISDTVDEKAIALAARRGDLEREAAAAYAQFFSEDELNEISAFYASPTGQKFIETHPEVTNQVFQAANIWQSGIARDLARDVASVLQGQVAEPQGEAAPAAVPAPEAAPAAPAQSN